MLDFAESVLKEIRKLRQSSEEMVLHGAIQDMERYRFVMGRLEALKLVEESVKELLKRRTDDQF
jgi:hypothetical protein